MHVKDLLRRYAQDRDAGRGTVNWLSYVIGLFERHLGRTMELGDLTDELVNDWTSAMLDAEILCRRTVHSYRRGLLTLWRYAEEAGHISTRPNRIRRIKVPKVVPSAWTAEQVGKLLNSALALDGYYRCGVQRATFWAAVVLVIWDSGLRIGDVLRLTVDQVSADGVGCLNQKKTGWPIVFRLSPPAVQAIEAIRGGGRKRIFGDVISRKTAFITFRKIAAHAGLSGGTKKIRKSGATAVERQMPGAAQGYLGHRTPTMAYEFYVDPRLLESARQLPPPLQLPRQE